jgi:hypothetical protein
MKAKIFPLVFALLLVSGTALAAVEKDEIVYARLDGAGALESAYVVNAFSVDEAGVYEDYGDYASAISLTPGLTATTDGGGVSLTLPAGRSYYQGAPQNLALPWIVSIGYTLDGAAVDAFSLAGARGHLGIEITVAENPSAQAGWYDAYSLEVSATLDASLCDNVVAEGATVVSAGSDYALSWIVTPGSETKLTLVADVTGFRMDPIQFAGVRLNVSIDDAAFSDQLDTFSTSAQAMATGIGGLGESLSDAGDAAGTLSTNADALAASMAAFHEKLSGDDALSTEFAALLAGYQGIATGIGELATGLDTAATAAQKVTANAAIFAAGIAKIDIGEMVKDAFGGEFEMRSFLSDRNADTRSVQFVLMTPGIE